MSSLESCGKKEPLPRAAAANKQQKGKGGILHEQREK